MYSICYYTILSFHIFTPNLIYNKLHSDFHCYTFTYNINIYIYHLSYVSYCAIFFRIRGLQVLHPSSLVCNTTDTKQQKNEYPYSYFHVQMCKYKHNNHLYLCISIQAHTHIHTQAQMHACIHTCMHKLNYSFLNSFTH